jgi:hypothetical protein
MALCASVYDKFLYDDLFFFFLHPNVFFFFVLCTTSGM